MYMCVVKIVPILVCACVYIVVSSGWWIRISDGCGVSSMTDMVVCGRRGKRRGEQGG